MKKFLSGFLALSFFASILIPVAHANPSFNQAESGAIQIDEAGSVYNITSSNGAIGNFNSFSNAAGETINSFQASPEHTALFRVTGGDPSTIFGALNANSRIFLVNPNGILFGPGSSVNAPGLVASALNISNSDFTNGSYAFNATSSTGGLVTNQGVLSGDYYVVLLGKAVRNEGTITSPGTAALAAGDSARLLLDPDGLVSIDVTAASSTAVYSADGSRVNDAIANTGTLSADGGAVLMTARAAEGIFDNVINHSGVAEARSVGVKNGVVTLSGGDQGVVRISGVIDVSGKNTGETGGSVTAAGEKVGLFENAFIDASGEAGGGKVRIGGGLHGRDADIENADFVFAGVDTRITADALGSGDGGIVTLWADQGTRFLGHISSRGGESSGKGGFVEVSGLEALDFQGFVDTRASDGTYGTLLLDPKNITINTTGTDVVNGNNFLYQAGSDVFLGNTSINAQASNVVLQANNDITLAAGSDISISANGVSLTMQAGRSILLNSNISTTGNAPITLIANERLLNGVQSANRDPGAAVIMMASGTTLNAGTGNIVIKLDTGAGLANATSGNITLENLTGVDVSVENFGLTAGSSILRASSSGLITASSAMLDVTATGTGDIGLTGAPIRLSVSNLEARAGGSSATEGIHIVTTGNVSIGGATLGSLTGMYAGIGSIDVTAVGTLTINERVNAVSNVTLSSGGSLLINDDTGGTDVSSGGTIDITVAANDVLFTLSPGATIVGNSGTQTYNADKIFIAGTITATGQTVRLRPWQSTDSIDLGSGSDLAANKLELADSELDNITAAAIEIGKAGNANALFSGNLTQASKNFKIISDTIKDANDVGPKLTTTGSVTLEAQSGIGGGSGGRLDVDAATLTATTGTGGIWVNLLDGTSDGATLSATTTQAGNIVVEGSSGVGLRTLSLLKTYNGSITVTSAGALALTDVRADTGVSGGNDVTVSATTGNVNLGYVSTDHNISITATNGNIVDTNAGALNTTSDGLTLTAPAGDIGSAVDPIEATYNSLTTSSLAPSASHTFVTKVVPSSGGSQTGGLTIVNGKIIGGESIDDLVTSLYGEEEAEEDDDKKQKPASSGATDSSDDTRLTEDIPLDPVPSVDARAFRPCGV